jgi:UDP-glucose 4-epimerase
VVRSGIEVYGRARGTTTVPDEDVPPDPTSHYGRMLLEVERLAAASGLSAGVPVTAIRMAPVVGPHFPSPLGRYLRLPVVPFSLVADPPFSVVHQQDAAAAMVAALHLDHDGPLNVVGAGAVTVAQAARLGGRVALPVAGPAWEVVRRGCELVGAPVPAHVLELLRRGRSADGARAVAVLRSAPRHSTLDVVKALYEWAPVTPIRAAGEAAA